MPDIQGMGGVLQVGNVVVAVCCIFVVHLPGIFTGRIAEEGKGHNPMDFEIFSANPCSEVTRRVRDQNEMTPRGSQIRP